MDSISESNYAYTPLEKLKRKYQISQKELEIVLALGDAGYFHQKYLRNETGMRLQELSNNVRRIYNQVGTASRILKERGLLFKVKKEPTMQESERTEYLLSLQGTKLYQETRLFRDSVVII